MKVKSVFEVGPVDDGIFIDNLMVCSADRLLSSQYRYLKNDLVDKYGLAATLFRHDLLNLAILVESIVCHDKIYINADYIDRWNSNIQESMLQSLNDILIAVSCPQDQRKETEDKLYEVFTGTRWGSAIQKLSDVVYRATHHDHMMDRRTRSLFLPHEEEIHHRGAPFHIVIGTAFYLMCSQVVGIPYKPSAIRAQLLSNQLEHDLRSQQFCAADLAISLMEKSREEVANEYFNKMLEFNVIETHLPCVLSAVLKEANSPGDVILIARQIRDSNESKAFRAWSRDFSVTIQEGDLARIGKFSKELDGVIEGINKYLGLGSDESLIVNLGWGPVGISHSFSLPKILKRPIYFKRHLWFLHNMYLGIATMARLSDHIERVLIGSLPKWFKSMLSQGKFN